MRKSTFILTTISAAATGAALGVLFAPNKGAKTRENISKRSKEYADYAADRFDDLVDTVSSTVDDIEEETADLASKAKTQAKETADDVGDRAAEASEKAKAKAKETADEARSQMNK